MNDKTVIKRNNTVVARSVGEKIIILDPKRGAVYTLNYSSAKIWKYLYKKRSIRDIVQKIVHDFKIPTEKAKKDILDFIKEGVRRKLFQISN